MSFNGYTGKLQELADFVTNDIVNIQGFWATIDPQLFADCKDRRLRYLQSCTPFALFITFSFFLTFLKIGFKDRPDSQAGTLLSYLLFEKALLPNENIELMANTQLKDIPERMKGILGSITSHMVYVHGQMEKEKAIDFYEAITHKIETGVADSCDSSTNQKGHLDEFERIHQIPAGSHHVLALEPFNREDPNNAYVLHFQVISLNLKVSFLFYFSLFFVAD